MAHDDADRPFDRWMWLCDCELCLAALKREAAEHPRLHLCLKTNCDRVVVTAEYLAEAMAHGPAEALCYVQGDWVREVFVLAGAWLPPSARWYSLTLDEEDRAAGRRRRWWHAKPATPSPRHLRLVGSTGHGERGRAHDP